MKQKTKVYFSGICGSGMKPLALLTSRFENYEIYGSDKSLQNNTNALWKIFRKYNIEVFSEPRIDLLQSSDFYVYSSAISDEHIEKKTALELERQNKIKVFHRMDFLNFIIKDYDIQIAISGTHGKTSSTSMAGWLLQNLCLSPTILVGGTPKFLPHSYQKGNGYIAVYETDESDGSFLKSNADYRLILNIDNDHLNYYNTMENLIEAFFLFSKDCGHCIINNDDENLKEFPKRLKNHYIGFGAKLPNHNYYKYFFLGELKNNILYIKILKNNITLYDSKREGIHFKFPGNHFLFNGLGVLALIFSLFLDYSTLSIRSLGNEILKNSTFNSLIRILNRFSGVERRVDFLGKYHSIDIYDDYAHHPKEIQKVLESIRQRYSDKIAVIFQPHRYSRTKELAREFAKSLEIADDIYLLPLYSANEEPIPGVTSELVGRFIRKNVHYLENGNFDFIFYQKYSCVIFLGAGDVSAQIREYLKNKAFITNSL